MKDKDLVRRVRAKLTASWTEAGQEEAAALLAMSDARLADAIWVDGLRTSPEVFVVIQPLLPGRRTSRPPSAPG